MDIGRTGKEKLAEDFEKIITLLTLKSPVRD